MNKFESNTKNKSLIFELHCMPFLFLIIKQFSKLLLLIILISNNLFYFNCSNEIKGPVHSHSLLQKIFLTQGSNPGLLHCRQIIYHLSHQRSPSISLLFWVSLVAQRVKSLPAPARDPGLIPGSGGFPWRKEWLPSPVFLLGEFHGQRSLAGYSLCKHKELDTTEWITHLLF